MFLILEYYFLLLTPAINKSPRPKSNTVADSGITAPGGVDHKLVADNKTTHNVVAASCIFIFLLLVFDQNSQTIQTVNMQKTHQIVRCRRPTINRIYDKIMYLFSCEINVILLQKVNRI